MEHFFGCLLIALSFCTVFKPYLGPLPALNLKLSMAAGFKKLMVRDTSGTYSTPLAPLTHLSETNTSSYQETVKAAEIMTDMMEPVTNKTEPVIKKMEPLCDVTERRGDICNIDGDVRIRGNSSSVFLVSSEMSILAGNNNSWSTRPYARKDDPAAMNPIKEWSIKLPLNAIKLRDDQHKMPQLLITSRKRTRSFTNIGEITKMASSLGYKVTVAEPTLNVSKSAKLVNSCDVLMGVHGAGLTNIVFLPKNAILIQIVPFGDFEWLARTDYGEPSKGYECKVLGIQNKHRREHSGTTIPS
uniref:Glycosyltransferase 61 catalytic domain-containing protein n=1 Tax=Quercus lobata TaxID=97700 RepID=A0A7N2RC48_QUELO